MRPNPIFVNEDVARGLAFAKAAGSCHLIMNGKGTSLTAHIPVHLSYDDKSLKLHLVRSNPIALAMRGGAAPAQLMIRSAWIYFP